MGRVPAHTHRENVVPFNFSFRICPFFEHGLQRSFMSRKVLSWLSKAPFRLSPHKRLNVEGYSQRIPIPMAVALSHQLTIHTVPSTHCPVFPCGRVPCFHYPFISWWASMLFPVSGYYDYSINERGWAGISVVRYRDTMVSLFWALWTVTLIFIVAVPVCIPTSNESMCPSSWCVLILAILTVYLS